MSHPPASVAVAHPHLLISLFLTAQTWIRAPSAFCPQVPADAKAYLHRAGRAGRFAPGLSAPPPVRAKPVTETPAGRKNIQSRTGPPHSMLSMQGTVVTFVASTHDEGALEEITAGLSVEVRQKLRAFAHTLSERPAPLLRPASTCRRQLVSCGSFRRLAPQMHTGELKVGRLLVKAATAGATATATSMVAHGGDAQRSDSGDKEVAAR